MDPGTIDSIRANNKTGRLFRPDNIIFSSAGTYYNWLKGYYTVGKALIDPIMDSIRREAEKTDCLQ